MENNSTSEMMEEIWNNLIKKAEQKPEFFINDEKGIIVTKDTVWRRWKNDCNGD